MSGLDFVQEWAADGLEEVTLPSGREIRIRLPKPRELVANGLLPVQLIADVLKHDHEHGGLTKVSEEDPELAGRLAESLRTLAADSIRQGRRTPDDEWEPITVTVETYSRLPDEDKLAIEGRIEATIAEADTAVDRLREFRGERSRDAGRKGRGAVRPAAVETAAGDAAGDRPRHRTRRAPLKG